MEEVYQKSHSFIDVSKTGRGKTIVIMKYAIDHKLPLLVVAPGNVLLGGATWANASTKYRPYILDFINYEALAGRRSPNMKGSGEVFLHHRLLSMDTTVLWIIFSQLLNFLSYCKMKISLQQVLRVQAE